MRYLISAMLAAFLTNWVAAASTGSNPYLHMKEKAQPSMSKTIAKRDLLRSDLDRLNSLSCLPGINAVATSAAAWIGSDGPYTNTFTNNAGENIILVIWGPLGSWVNVVSPLITLSMAPRASETISFMLAGGPGGWSTIYADTQMLNGQVSNTWGEFDFDLNGVVDVSRMPNMRGHGMSIVGPQCTANMNTCVFTCSSGDICTNDYMLQNCANQSGSQNGTFKGNPSGGCGWLGASNAALYTEFY